jgi:DNA modification methylase
MNDIDIIHNSCLDGMKEMKMYKKSVHLTVTSPPYFNVKEYTHYNNYQTYLQFLRETFSLIQDITEPGRMCCVNISNILIPRESRSKESQRIPLAFHFVPLMEEIGWKFIEDIVWIKPEGAAKNRNGGFFQHRQPVAYKPNIVNEYIFVFQKPCKGLIDAIVRKYKDDESKVADDYERTNIWKINPETKVKHPAPYPEGLAERLIKYYSFIGDTVLDPFLGSGTTALVSHKYKRKCIGFEIHKEYIDLFWSRINNNDKKKNTKKEEVKEEVQEEVQEDI